MYIYIYVSVYIKCTFAVFADVCRGLAGGSVCGDCHCIPVWRQVQVQNNRDDTESCGG